MNLIVFDLEFNSLKDMVNSRYADKKQCPNEIIEIGAVKLDRNLREIDCFKTYIKPVIYKSLHPRIVEITGIRDENLKDGLSFKEALEAFKNFAGDNFILCSWGKDDIGELIRNCNYHSIMDLSFIREYIDIQEYCTKVLGYSNSISLKNALLRLSVKFDEEVLHDGLYDSRYSAEAFKRLYNHRGIKKYIVTNIVSMPAITITDYENFVLDENKIESKCPKCGCSMEITHPIRFQSWRFIQLGYCKKCSNKLLHQVVIKKNLLGESVYKNSTIILNDKEYTIIENRLRKTS